MTLPKNNLIISLKCWEKITTNIDYIQHFFSKRAYEKKRHFHTNKRKNISQQQTHSSRNIKGYYSWRRKIILDGNIEIQNRIKTKNYKYMKKYK